MQGNRFIYIMPIKKQIVFATNNPHKLREIKEIVGNKYDILSLKEIGCNEEIRETGNTLEENARIKARYVKDNYGYDCFADDTGLEVEALGGAPGVYSARYAGEGHDARANMEKLLEKMQGQSNRKARFRTVIALLLNDVTTLMDGVVNGEITIEPRGNGGFGYDPVFCPENSRLTFAQMDENAKNAISHRGLATAKLIECLNKL